MNGKVTAHFYWIQGDEYVLLRQSCQKIIDRYPDAKVQSIRVENTTDWDALSQEIASPDLFASQSLWRIDFFDLVPDARALQFTRALVSDSLNIDRVQSPELVILYSSAILKSAQRKSKWYTALSAKAGIEVQWPMRPPEALSWARKQMSHHRVNLDAPALNYLMEKTEGNLSLLDSELYKLSLFRSDVEKPDQAIQFNLEQLCTNIEGDFSRFNPFALVNAALIDPMEKFIRMVGHFETEGLDINQLLGAMRFGLNQLIDLSVHSQNGQPPSERIRYLPPAQKTPTLNCLRRYNGDQLVRVLMDLSAVEKSARGISPLRAWDGLRNWGRRIRTGITTGSARTQKRSTIT